MTALDRFKNGLAGPTVILFVICAVITLALAAVYQVTYPIIRQGEIDAANETRSKVLTGAESFTKVDVSYPDGVSEIYRADDGSGYVILSSANGYGGAVTFMIGMDQDGNVVGIDLFDHNETPGLGTKVGNEEYLEQFYGDTAPDSVDAITGATRTSNALKASLNQAREAYEAAKGVS